MCSLRYKPLALTLVSLVCGWGTLTIIDNEAVNSQTPETYQINSQPSKNRTALFVQQAKTPPPPFEPTNSLARLLPFSTARIDVPENTLPKRDLRQLQQLLRQRGLLKKQPGMTHEVNEVEVNQTSPPTQLPGTGDTGFYILNGKGAYAAHEINSDLNLPVGGDYTLYAPTLMPPGNSCLESVTAYWRNSSMTDTGKAWGVWDHCVKQGWVVFKTMDSDFMKNYVRRISHGHPRYYTSVFKDITGKWHAIIFNFNTGNWEDAYSITGFSQYSTGWTIFETYFPPANCPNLPNTSARSIRVLNDSANWSFLASPNTSSLQPGPCFPNFYTFYVLQANYYWEVTTNH
ncbi:MAG TPA: hypothetical protein V6C85_06560 [Allocoleopsis sp.]